MKKRNGKIALLGFVMLALVVTSYCQSNKVPPFRMVRSDGKIFRAEDLPMGKPIVIIYFSPECEHCENLMKEVLKREKNLRKASIALITYLSVNSVSKFEKQYQLSNYKNMYAGTEGNSFFLKKYYEIDEMPFVAVYNKQGDLIKKYTRPANLDDLIRQLTKLPSSISN